MKIRRALCSDLDALRQLCLTTFIETYAAQNTPENLQLYLDQAFNAAQLLQELQSNTTAYFVLETDNSFVGYVKLNYNCCPPELPPASMLEIQRIYLLNAYQQQGLGKALLQFAEKEAVRTATPYLWLGVWEKNPKAIRFYEKQGFTSVGTHHFWVGNDCQTDFLMQKAAIVL